MAPTDQVAEIAKRAICGSGWYYSDGRCYRSGWYSWGRWVLAGVVILCAIVVLALLGCRNSRRRKRRGLQPMYGTGWMAPGPKYQQNNPGGYGAPPPQYSPGPAPNPYAGPPPNQYGQQPYYNQGYYSGQQEGIQPPQNTYYPQRGVGDENVYEPPPGPPPTK